MSELPLLQAVIPLLALSLLVAWLLLAERLWPLRDWTRPFWGRAKTHLLLAVPHLLVAQLVVLPVLIAAALFAEQSEIGLVRWLPVSSLPASVIAFIALDYSLYLWHRLTHRVSWLWRFHRVHHGDRDLSLATVLRFHFGETFCSAPFRAAAVVLVGADVFVVLVYEIALQGAVAFHHANWDLSRGFDRFLQRFLMTPRLHGIHHSNRELDTHSNFANLLNLWDHLHGTFHNSVRQHRIVIGAPHDASATDASAVQLLAAPFSTHPAHFSASAAKRKAGGFVVGNHPQDDEHEHQHPKEEAQPSESSLGFTR